MATSGGREVCGRWMPRAQAHCGRKPLHRGDCRTPESLTEHRVPLTGRRVGIRLNDDPAVRARWNRRYRLSQYGLTEEQFARLLATQQNACGMCRETFPDGGQICIDHDHSCCSTEKASCGECVRGLLCLSCNTALGHIERMLYIAQAYQKYPPARLLALELA